MTIYLSDVAKGHNNNFNIMRMLASTGVLISHAYPLSLGRGVGDPIHAIFGISLGTRMRHDILLHFWVLRCGEF